MTHTPETIAALSDHEIETLVMSKCIIIDEEWHSESRATLDTPTRIIAESIMNQVTHVVDYAIETLRSETNEELIEMKLHSYQEQLFAYDLMAMRLNISIVPEVKSALVELEVS